MCTGSRRGHERRHRGGSERGGVRRGAGVGHIGGTMINFGEKNGGIFGYYCLSGDVADLDARAEKDGCWSGSWAYCIDTGDTYMYDADGKRWILQ